MQKQTEAERYQRRPRATLTEEDGAWGTTGNVKFVVDCQSLAGILDGTIGTRDVRIRSICEETTQMLVELVRRGIRFHGSTSPPFIWRRRQFNKQADYAANTAMDVGKDRTANWMPDGGLTAPGWNAIAFSDGGCRRNASSYGWTILGIHESEHYELGWGYGPLPCEWDSFSAEALLQRRSSTPSSC